MTTVTKFDAQGFLRQGYSWSKLTGKAPAGVEVFPTGIVVGDKTQVSNGGWYKDADGRYKGSYVFMNTADLQAESAPPSVHKTAEIRIEVFEDGSYLIYEQSY